MIFSIVIPFTLNDATRTTNGVMHNLIMYLGITKTKKDREGRTWAVLVISVLENIPQFIVVVLEMVLLRKSVNFVQASNPLYSIAMIYKAMGPFIGMIFCAFAKLELITCGKIQFMIILTILMTPMILPQIFIDKVLSKNFIT